MTAGKILLRHSGRSPFDPHPESGHTYLHTRRGSRPTRRDLGGDILSMIPTETHRLATCTHQCLRHRVHFPAAYISNFKFGLSSTTTLDGIQRDDARRPHAHRGSVRLRVQTLQSNLDQNFSKLRSGSNRRRLVARLSNKEPPRACAPHQEVDLKSSLQAAPRERGTAL